MGFNISDKLGGDPALTEGGVWIDEISGLKLKITRWNNKKYRSALRGMVTTPDSKLERFKFDIDKMDQRTKDAVARHILVDWSGMEEDDESGKVVEVSYSAEKAREYFELYPEFYDMVIDYAQDIDLFKAKRQEEAAGN